MKEQEYHNKNWNVQDFERYHSGKMPDMEKHALEKAALDDPFLDDALEGYAHTKTAVTDIADLKNTLFPKREEAKIIWFKQKKTSLLVKIAAILIFFAGFAWLLNKNDADKTEEIATITKSATPANNSATSGNAASPTETNTTDHAIIDPVQVKEKASTVSSAKDTKFEATDKKETMAIVPGKIDASLAPANDVDMAEKTNIFAREKAAAAPTNANRQLTGKVSGITITNQNTIAGRVVDDGGNPIPFASIRNNNDKLALVADKDGYFVLKNNKNAANIKVDVDAVGYATTNAALNTGNQENKIILKESDQALSEVVVAGYQKSKKSSVNSPAKKVERDAFKNNHKIILSNAVPVAGWEQFNRFINDSVLINSPLPTSKKAVVILLFDLDSMGVAKNISIKKSLSDSADAAAKSMLLTVPALKKIRKGSKAEALIQF